MVVGICPSAHTLVKSSIENQFAVSPSDDDILDMYYELCVNVSNSVYHRTIDEYPLDLLWCCIITSPIINFLSIACKYDFITSIEPKILKKIITIGQLEMYEKINRHDLSNILGNFD